MSRFVIIIFASICVMASACAGTPPSQGTKLLFQTMTLLPDKTETISLPEQLNTGSGRVNVLVMVDREVSLPSGEASVNTSHLVFDGKEAARFYSSIRTSRDRTIKPESVTLWHADQPATPSIRVAFYFDMSFEKNEKVEQVSFRCDRKVTILEIVWLPEP